MDTTRKVGLVLTATAIGVWAVVVATFLSTYPHELPFGANLLSFVAVPLSLAAVVVLLLSLSTEARTAPTRASATRSRVGAGLAAVATIVLPAVLAVSRSDALAPATMTALLLAGVALFVVSFVFCAPLPPRRG